MSTDENLTHFLPLYAQVKQHLIQRIVDQVWAPGSALPSEYKLGVELGVSQGTVRKALDEMAAEKLVVRKQGRGTFVSEHTHEQELFHFFRLVDQHDQQYVPTSQVLSVEHSESTEYESKALGLAEGSLITRISRLRLLNGRPAIVETISVPRDLISDFPDRSAMPNSLYRFYQQSHGISVLRAVERIKVVLANDNEADLLGIARDVPLLEVERVAESIDGRLVELRVSRLVTDECRYRVELT